jgi:hypothetical protein
MERLGVVYAAFGMLSESCKWLDLASLSWQRQQRLLDYTRILRLLALMKARLGDRVGAMATDAERVYVESHELPQLSSTLQSRAMEGLDALQLLEQKLRGGVATRLEPDVECVCMPTVTCRLSPIECLLIARA